MPPKISTYLWFFLPLVVISTISLLILHSVDPQTGRDQLIYFLLSALIIIGLAKVDYHLYTFSPWPWLAASLLILLLTVIFGTSIRGSTRWVDIFGISLQTSELVKPLLVIFTATFLVQFAVKHRFKDLLLFFFLISLPATLIFLQPDLGTAILVGWIALSSLIVGGVKLKHLSIILVLIALAIPVGTYGLKPYQKDRLTSFINPNVDPLGSGYNARQATIAVGSGKVFGRGLGQGTQSHLRFLPERQTDFVFASLVEELGFAGGLLLLSAYGAFSLALIRAARQAATDTGAIICLTILSLLLFQVLINIGMNMGLMPVTGITLPLVSAGGSSVLSYAILIGIALSVALRPAGKKAKLEIK